MRMNNVAIAAMVLLGACGPVEEGAESPRGTSQMARPVDAVSAAEPTGRGSLGCRPQRYVPPTHCASEVDRDLDPMVQLALLVPGFGGFFRNGEPREGVTQAPAPFQYTAYLKDLSVAPLAAKRLSAMFDVPAEQIGFVQGTFDMLDLARWRCEALAGVGVAWTASGLNEARNRAFIAFETEAGRMCAAERLQALQQDGELQGVPLDSILLEVWGPAVPGRG
jgi:hypothetical protein